jgi:hypothetical protein
MKFRTLDRPGLTLLFAIILCVIAGRPAVAAPTAPTPVSPADGASVTEPFTISWTAVSDPSGIVAYNWQVSSSSAFTSVLLQNSTNGATQASVSGLNNGTYFWRVQAANGAFEQGAWSQPRSFIVTGAGSGAPSLAPTKGYSTFHPFEVMTFTWSAVPEAATYVLQYSTDSSFPVSTRGEFNNIPDTDFSFAIANPEGNYFARVFAVDANGNFSAPSNVISFSVFYSNPVPPPPAIVSPVNNPTLTLPITLTWEHVVNPQPSGYEIQIAKDSGFRTIEVDDPQLNGPTREILSLSPGTKFWRVRSAQGDSSPTTAALTAWSAVGTFTISTAPPTPVSVKLAKDPLYSGETTMLAVQLTAAVPVATTINLSSSDSGAISVPATITMPANTAWTQFQVQAGQVSVATPVTLTATLNSGSASAQFNLQPTSLNWITISPSTISGGATPQGIVMLKGQAPAGGALVSLSSNSPMVNPPASVTIEPGGFSASFPIPTSPVNANTVATVTANYNGVAAQAQVTLTPQQPPASLTLSPTSTTGLGGSSFGTVTVASPSSTDQILQVTSSNPAVASVPSGVVIPAGSTAGGFNIFTSSVSTQTVVTISVSGGGVTKTANLTVNPEAPTTPPTPGAPALLSPANDANVGQPITFDWSDVANATSYEIQIDNSKNFSAPLTFSQTVNASQTTVTGLPAQRLFWRVRAFNSAGVAGAFSSSRRFNAQAASTTTASLTAVSVSPTSVVGGTTAQGTITLTGAAPSGGALVTLSSSNTSVVSVPASVTVSAGAPSVNFGVNTSAVNANTAVTITATYGGISRTATLTVTPASTTAATLSAVSVSPTSVVGGATSQGTIALTGGAPSGGAVVTLTSSNTSVVSVPASVTVTAGASSATFSVNTAAVTANTAVTITATYGGISRTTTLTVTPASTSTLPAPSLLSPAADARFSPGTSITFDWTDVSGAASYTIQIDDSDTFSSPLVNQNTTVSQFTTNTLPTIRMWFRVRANSSSGTPGNWSSARRFEVKQ